MTTNINLPKRIYLITILIWLTLAIIPITAVIQSDIESAKDDFNKQSNSLYNLIAEQIKINETVIESFAATTSAVGLNNRQKIRNYAKQMSKRYPHIFMFEIAEKILKKDRARFERNFRRKVNPNFKIKNFSYETDRLWKIAKEKDFYIPITFMEPFRPESEEILGLDVSSNSFLLDSLKKAIKNHNSIASEPFTLAEGDLAYLIYKPIIKYGANISAHDHSFGVENRYAILVILAKSLFKNTPSITTEYNLKLYNSDFYDNENKGTLYQQPGIKPNTIESILFPKLIFNQKLNNKSQPFVLVIKHQPGWNTLSRGLLLVIFLAAILAFFVMLKYAKIYHLHEITRKQETDNLFHQANHDSLTGLANRNLLLDRLRHALKQADRSRTRLAVLFMDLNNFKHINDKYGHEAGDKLLQSASERLLACTRLGDTLARRSGDEFILILENIHNKEKAMMVVEKIKAAFEKSFYLNENQIHAGISIGVAIYPDNASSEEELFELADKQMYQDKRNDHEL